MAIVVTKPIVNNSQTKLLITGSGTTFTDSSAGGGGKTITRVADTTWSTTVKSPAVKAVYFDGTGDYLSTPDHADFAFAGDVTIDLHVYLKAFTAGNDVVYSHGTDNSNFFIFYHNASNGWRCFWKGKGDTFITETSSPMTLNTLHHIALVKNGTSWLIFEDGKQVASATNVNAYQDFTGTPYIGYVSNADFGTISIDASYMSQITIVKGQALWTSNFEPPLRHLA